MKKEEVKDAFFRGKGSWSVNESKLMMVLLEMNAEIEQLRKKITDHTG